MNRPLLILLTLFALSPAQAQSSYFGLHLDGVASFDPSTVVPLAGVQFGGPVLENLELRVSGLILVLANFVQVDLLYSYPLADDWRVYGGGGGYLGWVAFYDDGSVFGLHATAGLEYHVGSGIGLFGELQPLLLLHAPDLAYIPGRLLGKLNLGVNFHF